MKKISIVFASLLLSSVLVFPVQAENSETNIQNQNEFRSEIQNKRTAATEARATKTQDRKAEMEAKVTERKEKAEERQADRQERRSEIAAVHAKRLELHFANYYNRLNNLATKIQTRIDILKEKGEDISTAQTKLNTAKSSLETAKTYGDQAVAAFQAIDPTKYEEQRDKALAARDLALKAREAFRKALKEMQEAVEVLKSLQVEE